MVRSFKEFITEFDNEKVYTKRDMADALSKLKKDMQQRYQVNRVIQIGKDVNVALQIVGIRATPDGMIIEVK